MLKRIQKKGTKRTHKTRTCVDYDPSSDRAAAIPRKSVSWAFAMEANTVGPGLKERLLIHPNLHLDGQRQLEKKLVPLSILDKLIL